MKIEHKKSHGGFSSTKHFADVKFDDGNGATENKDIDIDTGYMSATDRVSWDVEHKVINDLTVTAHGLALYQKLPSEFYN
jgi:hypothetical protein